LTELFRVHDGLGLLLYQFKEKLVLKLIKMTNNKERMRITDRHQLQPSQLNNFHKEVTKFSKSKIQKFSPTLSLIIIIKMTVN